MRSISTDPLPDNSTHCRAASHGAGWSERGMPSQSTAKIHTSEQRSSLETRLLHIDIDHRNFYCGRALPMPHLSIRPVGIELRDNQIELVSWVEVGHSSSSPVLRFRFFELYFPH